MGYPIEKSNLTVPLRFPLVLTSDHITGATQKTPTVTICRNDGLGFVMPGGAVTEIGSGWYSVAANASDASTLGPLLLHATASACDPSDDTFLVVNFDPSVTVSQAPTSPTTMTVLDLITSVLREINVLGAGDTPSADDAMDGLRMVNDFIDGVCALERLLIYTITRTTWTLVASQASYAVGPSGDVNIVRPIYIDRVRFQETAVSPTLEMPLGLLTEADYRAVPRKALTSSYPVSYYYNPTFPTGTLKFFPIPTSTTLQGVLYAPTAVTRFGALTDVIALPPGYNRFLRKNLAVEFSAAWRDTLPINPILIKQATESTANLKRVNQRPIDMRLDLSWLGQGPVYDITSDT